MKFELFKRTMRWYEVNPGCNFIYHDAVTKLYYVIYYEGRMEFQGAGRTLEVAYGRLKNKLSTVPPLKNFRKMEKSELERTLTFKVML